MAVVYQPLDEQLEVFFVGTDGVLYDLWKDNDNPWKGPIGLTPPGFAPPGAHVAGAYYPTFKTLEVFAIDSHGAVNVVWKQNNGAWQAPHALTAAGSSVPGAPLAVVYQSLNEQLEVFFIGADGALYDVWKDNNNPWKGAVGLTPAGFAPPGAHVAGAYYPTFKTLEVFTTDNQGVVNDVWKLNNRAWQAPLSLTPTVHASPGAPLTVLYQPLNDQLEVFFTSTDGGLYDVWKDNNNPWKGPVRLATAQAGCGIAGLYYAPAEQLEVYSIDASGAFNVLWKNHNGAWQSPVGVTDQRFVAGAPIAAAVYPKYDHVEAFSVDRGGLLNVEWKVHNQAWLPCPVPLAGTPPPASPIPAVVDSPTVIRTERVGQLTGEPDPQNLPSLNPPNAGEWGGCGATGTDLGACTQLGDRIYFFFGDTLPGGGGGPAANTDLVAWTDDTELQPGGFTLHPVKDKDGHWFDPFAVQIGNNQPFTLPEGQTPTGAFTYNQTVYVMAVWSDHAEVTPPGWSNPPVSTLLTSKPNPGMPGPFKFEYKLSRFRDGSGAKFWQVAAVVVDNAQHPGLPSPDGQGVVLLGGGWGNQLCLAWMSLQPGSPDPSTIRYCTGDSSWTPAHTNVDDALAAEVSAVGLAPLPAHYTSISALWIEDAGQWVVAYSLANKPDPLLPAGPVVVRFAPNPWGPWSDEVPIFNPCRERAYGNFMHWSGMDDLNTRIPPTWLAWQDTPGFAYGAFMIDKFTNFDRDTRDLNLVYLMSTSSPYQVQVMRTVVRLPPPARVAPSSPTDTIAALASANIVRSVDESYLLDWLGNPYSGYPALAQALLSLLQGRRLEQPVEIDVVNGFYTGPQYLNQPTPLSADTVNIAALTTALLDASNERNGGNPTRLEDLLPA
ncbi:hypothetical protein A5787_08030 [Mycobacterium sp. 852002-50816_SCH5313054-b]|nr:hypothetical protein A5787_08030 [Mycobacterium sp. 852002-50816_SCH5313054-b]